MRRGGGFSQPNPPPSTIALSVAAHRSSRSVPEYCVRCSTQTLPSVVSSFMGPPSWPPFEKVRDQPQPRRLALLGVEWRADEVVAADRGGDPAAVIGRGDKVAVIGEAQLETVDEIDVGAPRQPLHDGMDAAGLQLVPPHMRNFEAGVGRFERHHLAPEPAEPGDGLELAAALGHQLHADADAEKRAAAAD